MIDNVPGSLHGLRGTPEGPASPQDVQRPQATLERDHKLRTRVATLFPNEASLLRLITAILSQVSEEWETNRIYFHLEA